MIWSGKRRNGCRRLQKNIPHLLILYFQNFACFYLFCDLLSHGHDSTHFTVGFENGFVHKFYEYFFFCVMSVKQNRSLTRNKPLALLINMVEDFFEALALCIRQTFE